LPGESESACEILKAILTRCTKSQLDATDSMGRTALHLSAIKRLPCITRILVEEKRTNVLITDDIVRTALHYAAEDGTFKNHFWHSLR
jgi:hypothetical protein